MAQMLCGTRSIGLFLIDFDGETIYFISVIPLHCLLRHKSLNFFLQVHLNLEEKYARSVACQVCVHLTNEINCSNHQKFQPKIDS